MTTLAIKAGSRFLHRHWIGEDRKPLLCVVTRIAQGCVYWKQPGERKATHYFMLADADRYVREVLPD